MATEISQESVDLIKTSLKKHGFEHALQRASVDAIAAGMDADDFTYQLVALFVTKILADSMRSHTDPEKKFLTLRGNAAAIIAVVQAVTMELAKQIDAEIAALRPKSDDETKH